MRILRFFILLLFVSVLLWRHAYAMDPALSQLEESMRNLQQTVEAMKSIIESQNNIIESQSMRLNALEKNAGPSRDLVPAPAQADRQGLLDRAATRGLSGLAKAPQTAGLAGLNPEIGAVGTVQAQLTENSEDAEGRDTIALKEFELSLAQYVDPYSRLDAILSFNDNLEKQNVDIEEAYYTHWGLPFGFKAQLGKFRSKIGKQNLLHLHQLETADYPLVIRDFFGEAGLSSSGVRLQNMIPNPWDMPLEISGEVLRGNNGPSFSGISRRPIFDTHLKSFFELSKEASLELGATAMFGDENPPRLGFDGGGNATSSRDPKGQDRYGVHIFGADATYLWNMGQSRILKFQNEIYFQDKSSLVTINQNPWGFYSLLDYRFSPRWSAGIRFDYLEPRAIRNFHESSLGVSPYLTLWQSEFADFRLQYSHTEAADPAQKSDDAVYLQANFLIGVHKHPVQ